ncbi:MAG: hypothetical protein LBE98_02830, partial [Puniceicoccales bacterium]|nr:hypothetical protein [Puniceicoccales bacterium]
MEKRVQRGSGGENPAVQGMPSGQKKKRGQFKDRDLSLASKILPDEIRKQSGVRTSHSGVPKGSRKVEHANHLAVNLGIWNCLRKLTVRILNKLVAFRLVNEQSSKNFLVHLLVAVKYNLDRSEVALLQTLASQGKVSGLDPSYFGEEDRKAFERAKHLHQILGGGIRKAFGGTTGGVNNWNDVRIRLRTMPLREARGIWQTIANEVAVDCSDATGHVDVERLETWMEFLGSAENFTESPFCYIPHAELVRSQMHRVCECLVLNRNGARDQLNAANGITVGGHGQSILATMSQGRESPLRPGEAILA